MRVLSGIQPTGDLHIGNYLGMIKQSVDLQEKAECVFPIVDLHAITIPYDPETYQERIRNTAIAYLSVGFDPKKSIIFVQSQVKEHTELCWLLGTICPLGELFRMTQYKDKSKQFSSKAGPGAGLLNYPLLMAADILLYKTDAVPVGKDQQQHIELTKSIARKFNQKFGKVFTEPEARIPKEGAKIMSLTDPRKKMSKSLGPQSYLSLFDSPETIRKKIMSAVTDPGKNIKYDIKRKPGISNLLLIYGLFSGKPINEIEIKFKDKGYAQFKKSMAELMEEKLEPFRRKKKELSMREVYVREVLEQGRKRAEIIAKNTMEEVRQKMGLQ
jgi:tryptophanyl-tRNA synthetase